MATQHIEHMLQALQYPLKGSFDVTNKALYQEVIHELEDKYVRPMNLFVLSCLVYSLCYSNLHKVSLCIGDAINETGYSWDSRDVDHTCILTEPDEDACCHIGAPNLSQRS